MRVSSPVRRWPAAVFLAVALGWGAAAGAQDYPTHEAYTRYLKQYPESETDWSNEAQGIAMDGSFWYIAQKGKLWAIHRSASLAAPPSDWRTKTASIGSFPELAGYNHFGDLDVIELEGRPHLLVPVENTSKDRCGLIALFTGYWPSDPGASLRYIASACVPFQGGTSAWVALDDEGFVYSSRFHDVSHINQFRIDWSRDYRGTKTLHLVCVEMIGPVAPSCKSGIDLFDQAGLWTRVDGLQGGDFTRSGEVLYLSTNHGLYAIRSRDGRILERSCEEGCRFRFDLSEGVGAEAEGLTVADLEEAVDIPGAARGQLHVLRLDNDDAKLESDDVSLWHYSGSVFAQPGGTGDGRFESPAGSFTQALGLAWNGARIVLRPGSYAGPARVDRYLEIEARGGPARIGD
jgi:hypothetical protein